MSSIRSAIAEKRQSERASAKTGHTDVICSRWRLHRQRPSKSAPKNAASRSSSLPGQPKTTCCRKALTWLVRETDKNRVETQQAKQLIHKQRIRPLWMALNGSESPLHTIFPLEDDTKGLNQ
jgi:hypothetical protein